MVPVRVTVILPWLLLGFMLAGAQVPVQYKFEHIDVNDGLSHSQINTFLKDSRGYIWIGTSSGLNRYDGYAIKTFRYDPRDTTTINSNSVTGLAEDPEGNIWVTTVQGLTIYDPLGEKFDQNIKKYVSKYQLPSGDIQNIVADQNYFWFIHANNGLTRFDINTRGIKRLSYSGPEGLSTNRISAIKADSQGDIWVIHRNGILEKVDAETLKVTEKYNNLHEQFSGREHQYNLTVDSDDDLWIYVPSDSYGVYFFNRNENRFINFTKSSKQLQLNTNLVRGVVEESKGIIWVGTDHGGINVINKRDFSVSYILNHPEIENTLVHNSIYSLYKDRDGIIWIGTYKNGLNYYHKDIIRFNHYKHLLSDRSSLPYDDVNRFVEDEKGNIWIGTNGGGLLYFDRLKNSFKQYKADPADPNSISSDVIVSMLLDSNNNLWIGTYYGGLDRFDGKKFIHYKNAPDNPQSLSDNNVWELFEDSRGNIWIGTLKGGLNLFNPKENAFYHYTADSLNSEVVIHSNYILSIAEDDSGNILVGGGAGVDIINKDTGKVTWLVNDPNDPKSLVHNTVFCLYKDQSGRMWIGTEEGLHLYDKEQGLCQLYTTNDGLPHNTILTILEDDDHNLWLSTPNGISKMVRDAEGVNDKKVHFINYSEKDGLQGTVFNDNAALKTRSGELVFGGANGFNIFNPDNIRGNKEAPQILFTDFQLFNKSLRVGEEYNGRVILPQSLLNTEEIVLKHDENVFSIEFAALNLLHNNKNKYRYQLEGFDDRWLDADDNTRRVTFTNLDPGNYTFRVVVSDNDGEWQESDSSIRIAVLAPFWKTELAYGIYILIVLAGLYLGRRAMLQRERMKFQIEQERRDARQMHELDLLKIRFFTNVSHEFRTPLSLILAPIDKLMNITTHPEQQKQFQMISRNARRLLNLVNQLLDFRKIEVDTINLHPSEGDIIKFIEESVHSFSDLSENKNVALNFTSNCKSLYTSFDMDKLEKILFNLLSNAFKFTPENGHIHVKVLYEGSGSLSEDPKTLRIEVEDSGIGIPEEQQERIFERFFRSDTPGSVVNPGSGIGLSITKEFVKIHGGTIAVKSESGKGSCFTITIPVKEITANVQEVQLLQPAEVAEGDSGFTEPSSSSELSSEIGCDGKSPVLLLVEDSADFRFYLKDNLGVYFRIIEAGNGKEGWQRALSALPDLIVSDLMMPEINGMDLCKKVKNDTRTSHIPFILLTADATDDKRLKGLNIGADDYVTKPFNFEILLSRIRNLIHQRQAMQQAWQKKISIQTSEIEIVSLDDKLIQNAIRLVEENISDPDFSVEMLSRELGMSRVNLYKKILSITGKSPVEFIRKIRIQRAAQILEKSQLTVAEVAYEVGFNNRKYFTKYFKSEYNILPSAYAASRKK